MMDFCRTWRQVIPVATCGLLLVSCGLSGSDSKTLQDRPLFTEDLAVIRLAPVDVRAVVVEETARCLDELGLSGDRYIESVQRNDRQRDGMYRSSPRSFAGLLPTLEVSDARETGYATVLRPTPQTDQPPDELSTDYSLALIDQNSAMASVEIPGVAVVEIRSGGCLATSYTHVYGSLEDWLLADSAVLNGIRQFSSEAVVSGRVVAAAAEYSECLKGSGLESSNPAETAVQVREKWPERASEIGDASLDEIAMAIEDAKCQRSSSVLDVAEIGTLYLAQDWLDENADMVRRAADAQRHAANVAKNA